MIWGGVITITNGQAIPVKQIEGIILDAKTGQSVDNVHVLRKDGQGITTGKEGMFNISVNGDQFLTITHIGYLNQFIEIPQTDTIDTYYLAVQLHRDTLSLNEVEIFPWPAEDNFKEEFLLLDVPTEVDQRRMIIPGLPQREGPPIPPAPTVLNPASFIYNVVSKEAIKKRRLKRYRKIILENAILDEDDLEE